MVTVYITNIKKVQSVQKRFIKRLKQLHDVGYQNRPIAIGLYRLEQRRLRAGLTLTHTIMFGLIDVDPNIFYYYKGPQLPDQFIDYAATLNGFMVVFIVFSFPVIGPWNSLLVDINSFTSFNSFKLSLDEGDLSESVYFS